MPKIVSPTEEDVCDFCGGPAVFISVNSKKKRCCDRVTQCPGVIAAAKQARASNGFDLSSHMKKMSKAGNERQRELAKDPLWLKRKSDRISDAVIRRGGHSGAGNPMFGRAHSNETREKMRQAAGLRDNTNIGRYVRTDYHRDLISKHAIRMLLNNKWKRSGNTRPERILKDLLAFNGIEFVHQYLIQFKDQTDQKVFRHLYDFKISETNVLIEVDGDYWHSLPQIIARDKVCGQIAMDRGFELLRFTEQSLLTDLDSVCATLGSVLGTHILRPH